MIAFTANNNFSNVSFKFHGTLEQLGQVIKKAKELGGVEISTFGTAFFKEALKVDPNVALGGESNWTLSSSERVIYNTAYNSVDVTDPKYRTIKFNGSLKEFIENSSPVEKLLKLKTKLLRFTYAGGTSEGIRIILLEDVKEKAGELTLHGYDLAHKASSTDKGYRTYKVNKIRGQIETLN